MNRSKIISSIIILSLIINLITIWAFYIFINKFGIIKFEKTEILPEITKIVEKRTIEEKKLEYLQLKDLENSITEAIRWSANSIVSIIITKDLKIYYEDPFDFFWWKIAEKTQKVWWWSWMIVSKDWFIITNKHIIQDENADYTVVTKDWDNYKVDKIRTDPILDIAVLKVVDENWTAPTDLSVVNLASIKDKVRTWQLVIAIWNALWEFQDSATFWIISWKWRTLDPWTNNSIYVWLYQTDTAINPWNSGWPLLDISWKVIWVNTAISTFWQNIWFAIPINKEFIDKTLAIITQKWEIERPFIWLAYVELTKTLAKKYNIEDNGGILVNDIISWSPADISWIRNEDIIIEINWEKIDKDNPFLYKLYTYWPWDSINLKIFSWWNYKTINITLWKYK